MKLTDITTSLELAKGLESIVDQLYKFGCSVGSESDDDYETSVMNPERALRELKILFKKNTVQAKRKIISEVIDKIEMWVDDGKIKTTEDITRLLEEQYLAKNKIIKFETK